MTMRAWCILDESESKEWQAVISKQNRSKVNEEVRISISSVEHHSCQARNVLKENAVMQLRGVIRTTKCRIESSTLHQYCHGWLNAQEAFCPDDRKKRDGRTPFERRYAKRPHEEFVPTGAKVLARPISTDPLNRMNPRYRFGIWFGVRNNSAECFVGTLEGVFGVCEDRRLEQKDRFGQTDGATSHLGSGADPTNTSCRCASSQVKNHWATLESPGSNAVKGSDGALAHSDQRRQGSFQATPQGAERLHRRNDALNEVLGKEMERSSKRKSSTEENSMVSSPHEEMRESPVALAPDAERRITSNSSCA